MNCDSLSEQIAKFRKAQGLTQEDLAKSVGVSSQAVSRWECGGAPDVTLLPAIADRLGVTIDALFGREGEERAASIRAGYKAQAEENAKAAAQAGDKQAQAEAVRKLRELERGNLEIAKRLLEA